MLKKLAILPVLLCAALSFAQLRPSFQAFDTDYLKLGEANRGYHHFIVRVDFAPWAFVAEGNVKAPQGDEDLLFNSLDNDQLSIVIAYAPSPIEGSDGLEYQAGIYDLMIYYSDDADDFATKIKDLKITLLPPIASDTWATGSLADAQGKRGNPGDVFKNPENRNAIFQASARPLSKAQAIAARKDAAEQKKNALKARRDSIAAAEQAARDAQAAAEMRRVNAQKARQDSIENARNRMNAAQATSPAYRTAPQQAAQQPASENLSPRQKRLQAMQAQDLANRQKAAAARQEQQVAPKPAAPADPCEDPSMTPLQKKRCRMNRK